MDGGERPVLLDMTRGELTGFIEGMGQPKYRAGQIYEWLNRGADFSDMLNLPARLREELSAAAIAQPVAISQAYKSVRDDTVKLLYELRDKNLIEGVLMRYHYGYSLCVSTQAGCRMGCAFCASTLGGLVRSLSAGEMLGQALAATKYLGKRIGHVVLMGSGEPLDNYDETVRFLRLISDEEGLNISLRSISLSTCGIVPGIRRLASEGLPITLSISLHAPNDKIRRSIMPIASAYPMGELMDAVRDYIDKTGRRVVFEYALISGVNASISDARELARLIKGLKCHVNLIPLNRVDERALDPAPPRAAAEFLAELERLRVSATLRREMGADVAGACGQLRNRHLKNPDKADNIN